MGQEEPKDEAVVTDLRARQLPLFDSHPVERLEAQVMASDLEVDTDNGAPLYNQVRYFVIKARVADVRHKEKKIPGTPIKVLTRIAGFEVLDSIEVESEEAGVHLAPRDNA